MCTLSGSLTDTESTAPQASSLFDEIKSISLRLSFDNYPTSLSGVMGPLLRTFVPACELVRTWGHLQPSVSPAFCWCSVRSVMTSVSSDNVRSCPCVFPEQLELDASLGSSSPCANSCAFYSALLSPAVPVHGPQR